MDRLISQMNPVKKLPISQPVQRTGEGTDFPLTIIVWKIARGQSVDSPVPFGELGRHQEARRMTFKVGDKIEIFKDPLTETRLEGEAVVVQIHHQDTTSMWASVRFRNEPMPVLRKIKIKNT